MTRCTIGFRASSAGQEAPGREPTQYHRRYLEELVMEGPAERIVELAARLDRGEAVTLLCSRDCILPQICHRTPLADRIEAVRARRAAAGS